MFISPVTSGLAANRGSSVVSGTIMISPRSIACWQNDISRGVSVTSVPVWARKTWRVSSTSDTSDTGASHSAAAKSVIRVSA